jgi:hypothetical protein
MPNQFSLAGTATLTLDNGTIRQSIAQTITMTGVNGIWQSLDLSQSVWTALPTSSLSDFRYGVFVNDLQTTGSNITIATGSAGQYPLATLQPDDVFILPGSGSGYPVKPLYASVTSGSLGVLQFMLSES